MSQIHAKVEQEISYTDHDSHEYRILIIKFCQLKLGKDDHDSLTEVRADQQDA